MPRKPDPELETRIIDAALRLLDRGGKTPLPCVRSLRKRGPRRPPFTSAFPTGTLCCGGLPNVRRKNSIRDCVNSTLSTKLAREYLRFSCDHPLRFDLTVETFGERSVAGEARPVFELFKSRLTSEVGVSGSKCDDLALAIASLFIGTARRLVAAGTHTRHANELKRASLTALQHLLKAFSDDGRGDKGHAKRLKQREAVGATRR